MKVKEAEPCSADQCLIGGDEAYVFISSPIKPPLLSPELSKALEEAFQDPINIEHQVAGNSYKPTEDGYSKCPQTR